MKAKHVLIMRGRQNPKMKQKEFDGRIKSQQKIKKTNMIVNAETEE